LPCQFQHSHCDSELLNQSLLFQDQPQFQWACARVKPCRNIKNIDIDILRNIDIDIVRNIDIDILRNIDIDIIRNIDIDILRNIDIDILRNIDIDILRNIDIDILRNIDIGIPRNIDIDIVRNIDIGIPRNIDIDIVRNIDIDILRNIDIGIPRNIDIDIVRNIDIDILRNIAREGYDQIRTARRRVGGETDMSLDCHVMRVMDNASQMNNRVVSCLWLILRDWRLIGMTASRTPRGNCTIFLHTSRRTYRMLCQLTKRLAVTFRLSHSNHRNVEN